MRTQQRAERRDRRQSDGCIPFDTIGDMPDRWIIAMKFASLLLCQVRRVVSQSSAESATDSAENCRPPLPCGLCREHRGRPIDGTRVTLGVFPSIVSGNLSPFTPSLHQHPRGRRRSAEAAASHLILERGVCRLCTGSAAARQHCSSVSLGGRRPGLSHSHPHAALPRPGPHAVS